MLKFKYQLVFLQTGEITESDYKYTYPNTAEKSALAFLKDAVKYGDRGPEEEVRLKIIEENAKAPLFDYGKASIESMINKLKQIR